MIYLTQSIHRNCQKYPTQLATTHNGREHTWTQLKDRVARFANALHQLGIKENDRVGILALNCDRYLEFYMSVPWAGSRSGGVEYAVVGKRECIFPQRFRD